ncbi:unnamed protein product [Clonostachys rhizophaga]|uniref:ABC transporter domain-containing protein n=1 Tax=Clonostachys rhizophaga TaxID=160324 RepID=A0A9N9YCA5_9HYPO|nr:unnamed protein product [Clonostachys rhizophaga]
MSDAHEKPLVEGMPSAFDGWVQETKQHPSNQAGLAYWDLDCHGFVSSTKYQHDFASYALAIPRLVWSFFSHDPGRKVQILKDFEGLVRPGEMLLVLGRPGSGCSTLLKALAGETHGFHLEDANKLNFGGFRYRQMGKDLKDERIYLAELDVHFPELTVGETLTFAASTRVSRATSKTSSNPRKTAERVASLFNLDEASKTQIGDAMIRGVSGGEKRRTSLAEAFISNARFQFWDNSTRGLDSSTALGFIKLLRRSTDALQLTLAMSVYQASEAMYKNFDKVLLLYEGRQIYFGPVDEAVGYFTELGFKKHDRATTADFLTSLTNPAERIIEHGHELTAPRTPDEFATAWKKSQNSQNLRSKIEEFNKAHPLQRNTTHHTINKQNGSPSSIISSHYALSITQQIAVCISRGFLRLKNNYVPAVSAVVAGAITAIIIGSVYFNLDDSTGDMERKAIMMFMAVMQTASAPAFDITYNTNGGFKQISLLWAQRPIVEKHDRYAFYYPVAEMFASIICILPQKVLESFLFHIPIYFMSNLRREASAFFTYWLFMFTTLMAMSMLFRVVGSITKRIEQTLAPVSTLTLLSIVYTGFAVPSTYMVPWMGWLRWINPAYYAYESIMINEFDDREFHCSTILPSGPQYDQLQMQDKICSSIGAVAGSSVVQGTTYLALKFGYVRSHLWRNLGILLAMLVLLTVVHLMASQLIKAQRSKGEILLFRKQHASKHWLAGGRGGDRESKVPNIFTQEAGDQANISGEDYDQDPVAGTPTSFVHDASAETVLRQTAVFHWNNLNYTIKTRDGHRQILKDINGWVKPGTLTVLMGVTGAGKTSLLDVLADRARSGVVSGHVYIDGNQRDASFGRRIGYAQQEDLHLPTTTVREALEFSALLRQPQTKVPLKDKIAYVDTVLKMLDMESWADAVVGVPGEGLNIEQRRRLTIAVELVAKPELLLFLDEPTSGLDSQTAWSICMLLRKLADNGQAILCTLHQPSSQLFEIFDRILLLGKGGEQLYFGDIGPSGSKVIEYFEKTGNLKCPDDGNPAEWIIEITREQTTTITPTEDGVRSHWAQVWDSSEHKQEVLERLEYLKHNSGGDSTFTDSRSGEYAAPLVRQFYLVLKRNFQEYWRDPISLYSKLGLCLGISLSIGLSFTNTTLDMQGLTNLTFASLLVVLLFAMLDQQVIKRFISERDMFEARERRNRSYSWIIFVSSNIVVELFWQTIASVLFFITWYYPTGMWRNGDADFSTSERAGLVFMLIWFFCLFISTLSHAVAIAIPLAETAVQIAALLYWFMIMFCGILIFPNDLPDFWVFVHRASPFTYLINGLLAAGLGNVEILCSPVQQLRFNLPSTVVESGKTCGEYLASYVQMAGGTVINKDETMGQCFYCPVDSTNDFFKGVGIDLHKRWRNVGYLAVYIMFNIILTFGLYWLARVPGRRKPS